MAVNVKTKQTHNPKANDSSNCRLNHSKMILFFLLKFLLEIKLVFY